VTKHVAQSGGELKLLLNIGSYDLSLKGQVRHATGRGNGNRISARETGKSYTFPLQKLSPETQLKEDAAL